MIIIHLSLGVAPDTTRTLGCTHIDSSNINNVAVPITPLNTTIGSTVMLWAVLQRGTIKRGAYEHPGPYVIVKGVNSQYGG